MPALKTKQYLVATLSTDVNKTPGPAVPERAYLAVQNTGANEGLFRFGGPVRRDGSDIEFATGAMVIFSSYPGLCPTESLNFASVAGTTWAVVEGTILTPKGGR